MQKIENIIQDIDFSKYVSRCTCSKIHVAVLLAGTKIVKIETNFHDAYSPFSNGIMVHAELAVIEKYLQDIYKVQYCFKKDLILAFRRNRFNLLVLQINKDKSFGMSEPCLDCLEMLDIFGIKKIYWSIQGGIIKSERISNMTNQHRSIGARRYSICKNY